MLCGQRTRRNSAGQPGSRGATEARSCPCRPHAIVARVIGTMNTNAPTWADLAEIECSNMATEVAMKCVEFYGILSINPDNFITHHHLDSIGFAVGMGTPSLHVTGAAEGLGFSNSDDLSRI